MKAAVVREFGKPLVIEEVPVPTVGAGQIVVKIAATGVCHTDLHAVDGDWPVKPKPPFIPGHEGVGHVGAGVRTSVTRSNTNSSRYTRAGHGRLCGPHQAAKAKGSPSTAIFSRLRLFV